MKPPHPTQSPDFKPTYFGKYIYDLYRLFVEQGDMVHDARGLKCPTEVSSVLHYLYLHEPTSVTEMANALGLDHQLIGHRIGKLSKQGIVKRQPDSNDRRRYELVLTDYGRKQAALLEDIHGDADIVYSALCEEIGVDLPTTLTAAFMALKRKPLATRFAETVVPQLTSEEA